MKEPRKRDRMMDRILALIAVVLILFTVAVFIVFWHTGNEPAVLVGCVFGVCGLECGVMGWIKTTKDRIRKKLEELDDNQDLPDDETEKGDGD